MVKMLLGTAAVSTLGDLVASHAHIGRVTELEAVLAYRVFVVRVHVFCLAGPVVNAPGCLLS